MRIYFLAFILFFISLVPARAFVLSNFEVPESMIADPSTGFYYVSNIVGNPADKDGNGYISKISADGNLVIQKFIGGKEGKPVLSAPKGLAILEDILYVTDIDNVKGFDTETGKLEVMIDFVDFTPKFLNDICVYDHVLYVSDTFTNRIFQINIDKEHEITVFKEGEELGNPNGLMVNPRSKNLMVATWETGKILEIDPSGNVHVLKSGFTSLDGLDYDSPGDIYASDFKEGIIYKIGFYGRGPVTTFLSGLITPADISVNRKGKKDEILIPSLKGNTGTTVPRLKNLSSE